MRLICAALCATALTMVAFAQTPEQRTEAPGDRLEKAVERSEAAGRLEALAAGDGPKAGGVNAGPSETLPPDIPPEEIHDALKRQLQCLDACQGTRVAVTSFGGVTFGKWRHPTDGELAVSIGAYDGWLIPAQMSFQTRRYYADYTLIEDHVWDVKVYRGDNGTVTFYNSGHGSTSKTTERREGPQLPPSP